VTERAGLSDSGLAAATKSPGYWNRSGASLFDCLDLLRSASGGSVDYFDLPPVRQIGAYICKVHITPAYRNR